MKLILKIVLIIGLVWAKMINPIHSHEIEILEIKGKEREYNVLRNAKCLTGFQALQRLTLTVIPK